MSTGLILHAFYTIVLHHLLSLTRWIGFRGKVWPESGPHWPKLKLSFYHKHNCHKELLAVQVRGTGFGRTPEAPGRPTAGLEGPSGSLRSAGAVAKSVKTYMLHRAGSLVILSPPGRGPGLPQKSGPREPESGPLAWGDHFGALAKALNFKS